MRQTAYMLIELCVTMVFSSLPLTAQGATPALLYYADAYADHYGVPRVLVHSIISAADARDCAQIRGTKPLFAS